MLLDESFEWPGTIHRVVSLVSDERDRVFGYLQVEPLSLEPRLQILNE